MRFLMPLAVAFSCLAVKAESAPVFDDHTLVSVLDVYVDGVLAAHAGITACDPQKSDATWEEGRQLFIASLWANYLPPTVVRAIDERLKAPAIQNAAVCDGPNQERLKRLAEQGWPKIHSEALQGIGLVALSAAPKPGRADAIAALFRQEAPLQSRMLECVAALEPTEFPALAANWALTVSETQRLMTAAGLPIEDVARVVKPVQLRGLWRPASDEARNAIAAACQKEEAWRLRWERSLYASTLLEIKKILGFSS